MLILRPVCEILLPFNFYMVCYYWLYSEKALSKKALSKKAPSKKALSEKALSKKAPSNTKAPYT